MPQQDVSGNAQTDITIYLNHSDTAVGIKPHARGWLLNDVDVKPPESVPCAEFERLQIQWDLCTIQMTNGPPNKRRKSHTKEPGSPDMMLLDSFVGLSNDNHLRGLEEVVDRLTRDLSASIADKFYYVDATRSNIDVEPFQSWSIPSTSPCYLAGQTAIILQRWFDAHSGKPYPTEEEKQMLMKETSLTTSKPISHSTSSNGDSG